MSIKELINRILSWPKRLIRFFTLARIRAFVASMVVLAVVASAILATTFIREPGTFKKWMAFLGGKTAELSRYIPAALPEESPIKKAIWLEQNWSNEDRFWFHHTSQGTATIPVPYDWFISLEQPEVYILRDPKLLSDPTYLSRFGFIPSMTQETFRNGSDDDLLKYGYIRTKTRGAYMDVDRAAREGDTGFPDNIGPNIDGTQHGLPVGFAKLAKSKEPVEIPRDMVGFTCAACHTGHLEYGEVSLRFDGGPAMLDLGKLEAAIGLSIGYTLQWPLSIGRFDRFADRVFALEDKRAGKGNGAAGQERSERKKRLRAELERTLNYLRVRLKWRTDIKNRRGTKDVTEGYGRLDALNRIGNQVFFENLLSPKLVACALAVQSGVDAEKSDRCLKDYGGEFPEPPRELAENYRRIDAPVSFPPIWSVSWFSWAQYDASVFNVLVRNAGEALGVSAIFHTRLGAGTPSYQSSMKLENIYWLEQTLAGKGPLEGKPGFKGLKAPKWPAEHFPDDEAWQITADLVTKGRELYRDNCAECHLAPISDPEYDSLWSEKSVWRQTEETADDTSEFKKVNDWLHIRGEKLLDVVQKPVKDMGTDPQQSRVLTTRKINIPKDLKLDPIAILNRDLPNDNCGVPNDPALRPVFALALMGIVDKAIDQWFLDYPNHRSKEGEMRGRRPNCPNPRVFRPVDQIERPDAAGGQTGDSSAYLALDPKADDTTQAKARKKIVVRPVYRARPLDGIWATAPYLHNGSVASLEEMLKPASQRRTSFCVGSRQFDPVSVGLKLMEDCPPGFTLLDTTALGSSNSGHSFEAEEGKPKSAYAPGVIGREFKPDERRQLIEYLKTL